MATCRQCKTYFHACSSCGLQDYEWDFCNSVCRDEWQKDHNHKVRLFWESLTKHQQNLFDEIADDEYLLEMLVEGKFLE